MRDARYLLRMAPSETVSPVDAAALLNEVRRRLGATSARAINLRVSSRAIEFDLFMAPSDSLESALTALQTMGELVTQKRLDVLPPPVIAEQIVHEARELFNQERFWEVHEVLEGLWKECAGSEKQLVQGLILAAAAFVHRQKNENAVVPAMLKEALRRLETQPETYYGWNIAQFVRALEAALKNPEAPVPTV